MLRSLQEEQRRVSNKEMCRDELLALLRDASSLKQSFSAAKQPAVTHEGTVLALELPPVGMIERQGWQIMPSWLACVFYEGSYALKIRVWLGRLSQIHP